MIFKHILALLIFPICTFVVCEGTEPRDEFDTLIRPFIKENCLDCHGSDSPEAEVNLEKLEASFNTLESITHWQTILEQLQTDLMPPLSESRPSKKTKVQVVQWIESQILASKFGKSLRRKMMLPQFGNYVDHDLLFNGQIKDKPYTPARIWRTSPYQFQSQRRVGKVKGLQNPFTFSTPDSSIRDYASASDVGSSVVETIMLNANAEIEYLISQAKASLGRPTSKKTRVPILAPFLASNKPDLEQKQRAISETFQRLTSRSPNSVEIAKYVSLLDEILAETGDAEKSIKATLQAIYLSPEAIYRMEWGLGKSDEFGRRILSPEEIAFALSYALFDQGPFAGGRQANQKMIQQALASNQLQTPEHVRAVVERILGTEEYRPIGGKATDNLPRVLRFFREFFGYHRAIDVFKDQRRVNEHGLYHNPRRLVQDADNLIKIILRDDKQVFERMLTTNKALVFHDGNNIAKLERHNQLIKELEAYNEESVRKEIEKRKAGVLKKPKYKANPKLVPAEMARIDRAGKSLLKEKKAELARLKKNGVSLGRVKSRDYRYIRAYNLDTREWKWPAQQPFELPREERAGILTHPAWLAAHSTNDDNHPIIRGIWIYEKLLGGVIGDVPPSVDARVPEDPHKTLRERLNVVKQDQCWKCHFKINPLGEAFEIYDDFGRFRKHHFFDEQGKLTTRSVKHVLNEENKEVLQAIDREQLVKQGKFSTRPVMADGSFAELGLEELDGDFRDAVDMIHQIASTARARQSIIRHLFRYFMGRNEMLSDSQTLINADKEYVNSGGSFRAVLVSLLSSDSFLYRK